jgi:integrase
MKSMTRLRLRYVDEIKDRYGKTRYYFRRAGQRVPLPGHPGSAEFMAAYQAALDPTPEVKIEIGVSRTAPGTINAAIVAFYKSLGFTKNRSITRQTDSNILEAFRAKHGDKRIALMERKHVLNIIAEKAGKPAAQRNLLRVIRILLAFAVEQGLRPDNPALGIKLKPVDTDGYHSWTEEELRQYEERHPVGTKARLALAVPLYTAQRRTDVVALGPPNISVGENGEQRLRFTQSKTGAVMDIPLAVPLAEIIAATNMVGVKTFLVTDQGRPFTPAGFGNWFRERCNEAGLTQCSAHGLRKAFLRRMAEAGCSEDFIASISGHKDMREIRVYVAAANKSRMATEGMARTLARFETGKRTP